MNLSHLSRRGFLKMGSLSALGLFAPRFWPAGEPYQAETANYQIGRIIRSQRYYDVPSLSGLELGYYPTDSVVKIYEKRAGDPEPAHNPFWFRTDDGWMHSSFVQMVRDEPNNPGTDVTPGGFLAEVTVPYLEAYVYKKRELKRAHRFYYGTTYWVVGIDSDSTGALWCKIDDDLEDLYYLVHAEGLRRVTAEEITQISPGVPGKRIEVNLAAQRLTAYEGSRIVFTTRVSTGKGAGATPAGEYRIERKAPTSHMSASEFGGNGYDLPGVPWCSFIFWNGISIHGTYWHNNFGTPMSHGCINLTPEAAKWIYRWSDPTVPFEKNYLKAEGGTPVSVF